MARMQWWRTEPPVRLTQHQFVLVALYVGGATSREAAAILGLQFGTFSKLLRRIRSKFATAGIAAGTRIELEQAVHAHPTLVVLPDGTERLVRPYVPTSQHPGT